MINSLDPIIGASLVESLVASHVLEPQPPQQPLFPAAAFIDNKENNDNHQTCNDNSEKNNETVMETEEEAPTAAESPPPPLITNTPFPSRYHHDSLLLAAVHPNHPKESSRRGPLLNDDDRRRSRCRDRNCLLIKGPEKSGRTSLLLDLAMSMASTTPCRCSPPQKSSSTNSHDDAAEKQDKEGGEDDSSTVFECRGCVAVTIFRPAVAAETLHAKVGNDGECHRDVDIENANNNSEGHHQHVDDEYHDTEEFPLFCHKMLVSTSASNNATTLEASTTATMPHYANANATTNSTNQSTTSVTAVATLDNSKNNSNSKGKTSAADGQNNSHLANEKEQALLLSRIQVHHVTSARHILSYLLQVQGFSRQEQPWGGILIDDLHSFGLSSSINNNRNNNNADYNVVLLSQVGTLEPCYT
jgi:hypothetical protein